MCFRWRFKLVPFPLQRLCHTYITLSCRPLHRFGRLRERRWSFPPGPPLSHSACHSHTDQKGFCRLLSLIHALYVGVIQMPRLRDAHLKDIIAINPKGPEALLTNASARESQPPRRQQCLLRHLAFFAGEPLSKQQSDATLHNSWAHRVVTQVQMSGFLFPREFKFCTPGTPHPTAATASTFIKLS